MVSALVFSDTLGPQKGNGMNVTQDFNNSPMLDFAKRVLRESVVAKGFWFGLVGVIAILVISGPFTTADVMSIWERGIYWLVIATLTYFCAVGCAALIYAMLHPRIADWRVNSLISGLVAGLPVATLVIVSNAYVFKVGYGNLGGYTELAIGCVIVSVVGTFLHQTVNVDLRQLQPQANPRAGQAAPILKRLEPRIRAQVVSLHAQGHYVEVTTLRGKQLVLMRLKDAIAELEPDCGRQVHRSWWVRKQQVQAARRTSGRVVLQLEDGRQVPVSRYNLSEIRHWMTTETTHA